MDKQLRNEKEMFLASARSFAEHDPESIPLLIQVLTSGLQKAISQEREKSADMEIIASVLLMRKFKNRDELIKNKLKKWEGKCSLRWDWFLHPETEKREE